MALVECVECGHQISDQASSCPRCGCPVGDLDAEGSPVHAYTPDSLRIEVRPISDPDQESSDVVAVMDLDGWVADSSPEGVADSLVDALAGPEGYPPPFVLDIRRSYLSWGADGAVVTIALGFLGSLLAGATWTGLQAFFRRLAQPTIDHERSMGIGQQTVSRDEAKARSQWYVSASFDVEFDDLSLVREAERADGSWEFEFADGNSEYVVEATQVEGFAVIARLERRVAGTEDQGRV